MYHLSIHCYIEELSAFEINGSLEVDKVIRLVVNHSQ